MHNFRLTKALDASKFAFLAKTKGIKVSEWSNGTGQTVAGSRGDGNPTVNGSDDGSRGFFYRWFSRRRFRLGHAQRQGFAVVVVARDGSKGSRGRHNGREDDERELHD